MVSVIVVVLFFVLLFGAPIARAWWVGGAADRQEKRAVDAGNAQARALRDSILSHN